VVNFDHPANRGVLAYFGDPERLRRSVSSAKAERECAPDAVTSPYMTLGTHPDLVVRLWSELGRLMPADCRSVVFGVPALVRPDTGVIFGFAGGTQMYALRLDGPGESAALAAGARRTFCYPAYSSLGIDELVIDLTSFGDGWIFGRWYSGEPEWALAAYAAAV
jgi:hypothetical protein